MSPTASSTSQCNTTQPPNHPTTQPTQAYDVSTNEVGSVVQDVVQRNQDIASDYSVI